MKQHWGTGKIQKNNLRTTLRTIAKNIAMVVEQICKALAKTTYRLNGLRTVPPLYDFESLR